MVVVLADADVVEEVLDPVPVVLETDAAVVLEELELEVLVIELELELELELDELPGAFCKYPEDLLTGLPKL